MMYTVLLVELDMAGLRMHALHQGPTSIERLIKV
jgi:hypothetical protein